MDEFHLGPNGGLVYCMEFLSKNFEWLSDKIKSMLEEDKYLLIDCPGQVILLAFSLHHLEIFNHIQGDRGGQGPGLG